MKKLILILILTPTYTLALTHPCVVPGSSVEIDMTRAMVRAMNIDQQDMTCTNMKLLAVAPVDKSLANFYANQDRAADLARLGKYSLSYEAYFSSYFGHGAKTLVIEYTYQNVAKQKNVLVASSLVNDNECSVRFNGYVIVQRAF